MRHRGLFLASYIERDIKNIIIIYILDGYLSEFKNSDSEKSVDAGINYSGWVLDQKKKDGAIFFSERDKLLF